MPDEPQAPSGAAAGAPDAAADTEGIRSTADAVVQRAADALRAQLKQVAAQIDPFPSFPGSVFAYGIEVEPADGGDPALGCVILGNDGALYELEIGLDSSQLGTDASAERHEELRPLDVPPVTFLRYAHAALHAAADYLDGRAAGS